jgi:hypothetical protein
MGELSIKDVNTLFNKSISHMKKSLYHFSDALIKLEWTVKEQKILSKFDYLEVKRQIRKQKHFVVELNRLAERKRKLLKLYRENKKTNH